MPYWKIVVVVLNSIACLPSLASATKFDYWWIRAFDFPRIQISLFMVVNIMMAIFVYPFDAFWHYLILLGMLSALIYQCVLIFPYTILAKKQVINYEGGANEDNISILVSNVLTENSSYNKLIDLIFSINPDVVLTLESDRNWEKALLPIEERFAYTVKIPLDNLYGMHLYSKLALMDIEVKYLIQDDIPSIHGSIELKNGKKAAIHCLHPRPPSPSESKTSTNRDAELLLVGREIDKNDERVLVFGDFNDVAWSRTTKLFQELSGLMDPRRGRGFFNTYNANHKFLRWPLDHVFHSNDFTLMEITREKHIGSDHFPMYIKLNYTPKAKSEQDNLNLDTEGKQWAEDKIEKANPNSEDI